MSDSRPTQPPRPPEADAPARDRPRRRWGVLAALVLVLVQAAAFLPSPAWNIDLRNQALHGFPRLLGVWPPVAILVLFFAGVPAFLFVWELLSLPARRAWVRRWWVAWVLLVGVIAATEGYLRARPFRLPYGVIPYLSYGGWLTYPVGVQIYTDDPLLLMRPASNMTHRVRLDGYTMGGSLFGGESGRPASAKAGGEDYFATRRTNKYGFDADFGSLLDEDHPATIAALGDSFTVGYPLPAEMTWPGVMAAHLAESGLAPPADPSSPLSAVATFACGNYTPYDSLMALRLQVPPEMPGVIVALYYEANDLTDAQWNAKRRSIGMSPVEDFRRAELRVPESWLTKLRLHALVAAAIAPTDIRLAPKWRRYPWMRVVQRPRDELARLQADPVLGTAYSRVEGQLRWRDQLLPSILVEVGGEKVETAIDSREVILAASPGEWPPAHTGWPHLLAGLEELAGLQREAGVRVIVALAPSKLRTYLPFIDDAELSADRLDPLPSQRGEMYLAFNLRKRQKSWPDLLRGNEATISRHLERECGRLRLEFIDLAEPLREAIRSEGRLPYLPWDSHWNSLGQRVAGETIAAWLAKTSVPGSLDPVDSIEEFLPPIPPPLEELDPDWMMEFAPPEAEAGEHAETGAAEEAGDKGDRTRGTTTAPESPGLDTDAVEGGSWDLNAISPRNDAQSSAP
jgi:hypothetical protein